MTDVAGSGPGWIEPDWPAPANVRAAISTRQGGVSAAPFNSQNLALHVGDDPAAVAQNRARLLQELQIPQGVQWLEQVHGCKMVGASADGRVRTADACITAARGLACAVMTADCLPLLICDSAGTQVAAVHAGWRGLAAGMVRRALEGFKAPAQQLLVYLGPAISQPRFEVGIEVLEAFYGTAADLDHLQAISAAFAPSPTHPLKYHADLYALARAELRAAGVTHIYGGQYCTYADSDLFYSYRRDTTTGRMASLIWLV
ncbi:peptidoglycan editing factor PgeF [Pseudomaricurvus alcaniphilus]|uniref:peptidoglycan editing factor PgeF n=1 Tax=Pseudomaricurvus alcaniphilus TaxID=1166482 RepID=UPI00140DDEAB|nr:peptidoglycan editing factor PgeF [Pseudomaricurvus alcaniphilus]NHN39309.1 peptidoglycan editing factor PgeF [Pseudomaricurvus alcaniphilus]